MHCYTLPRLDPIFISLGIMDLFSFKTSLYLNLLNFVETDALVDFMVHQPL